MKFGLQPDNCLGSKYSPHQQRKKSHIGSTPYDHPATKFRFREAQQPAEQGKKKDPENKKETLGKMKAERLEFQTFKLKVKSKQSQAQSACQPRKAMPSSLLSTTQEWLCCQSVIYVFPSAQYIPGVLEPRAAKKPPDPHKPPSYLLVRGLTAPDAIVSLFFKLMLGVVFTA
eukprot:1144503-Pelagomonas_calceolata.AAC.5